MRGNRAAPRIGGVCHERVHEHRGGRVRHGGAVG